MRSYFYKVPYGGEDKSHWLFGRFQNKNEVIAANDGKAFEILTISQLFEKHNTEEVLGIARNCLVYQPEAIGEFPTEVAELLK